MKVVLMHDWLTGYRGGERVLEVFCEMFPDAPLYTLIHKKGSVPPPIENRKITTSFLNKIPGISEHYRKCLPLFPRAADSLKIVEKADLVLSSSHCVIKGIKKPIGSKHLCYIHSPMRYIYDQFDNYFGPDAPFYQRFGMSLCQKHLRDWDLSSNQNVDLFAANSAFVKERIKTYYHLDSEVVHPFVDLADFNNLEVIPKLESKDEEFYLMVSAFAPNKKVDLAIEAFNKMGKKLKIIGSGQKENYLKSIAKNNIEFLGSLSRNEVIDHYQKAKAFIFPGVEDFGITPLESLAAGTPVIAYEFGGVLETMTEQTCVFFKESNSDGLIRAVKSFEERKFDIINLKERANEFSKNHFKKNIEKMIEKMITK